jgi:hypothetical protein
MDFAGEGSYPLAGIIVLTQTQIIVLTQFVANQEEYPHLIVGKTT